MKPRISMKPRSRKPLGVLAMTLLLPACATVSTPEYPIQHPANAEAVQAAAPTTSSALDTYRPAPAGKNQSGQPASSAEPSSHAVPGNSAQEPADEPGKDDHDHH
jgi:hypothetical protein